MLIEVKFQMNEMSTKMKKVILIIINILTLSSCGIDQDDHLVRWWNGNIPSNYPISDEEKKIMKICYEKTKDLPKNTTEEREKSFSEYLKCEEQIKSYSKLIEQMNLSIKCNNNKKRINDGLSFFFI